MLSSNAGLRLGSQTSSEKGKKRQPDGGGKGSGGRKGSEIFQSPCP